MYKLKLYGLQVTIVICSLLTSSSCNNGQEKDTAMPTVKEPMQDSVATNSTTVSMPQAGPHKFIVEIKKMQFTPGEVSIQKGDTVVWINNDLTNHCVTDSNKAWTSSTLVPGKYWQKVFNKSADYFCAIHLVMKGKVLVK